MVMVEHFQRLRPGQRHAFWASFLGWSLDSFDFFLLVLCVSSIAAEFHTAVSSVARAIFLTLAFRPVGAVLFGAIADRFGRKPALMLNIAAYSVLELCCAFAPSLQSLLVLRALFGIAMGGVWGVGSALAFETLPVEGRGLFSGLLQEGYAVGYLLAAAVYAALYPVFAVMAWHGHTAGWRGLFVAGAAPALLVFYVAFKVEESPVWLERRRAHIAEPRRSTRARVSSSIDGIRAHGMTFLFLVLLMTGFNSFSHGTQDLYPTFLQHDHHISPRLTGTIAVIYNVGALLGGVFFGSLSERFGRKRTIIAAALLSLPVIPLFASSTSIYWITGGAFLMQFMVQGAWGVVPAYLSELSPPAVRATFPGLAYQLGSLITSRNIVVQSWAAERVGSFGPVLAVSVLVIALYLALVTLFGRESRGVDLAV
ncbi:MAG TPA: MFS transporter [Acidisarcina sp.]